jgi:transcriptional regulator with XRE-family HTH domain
MEGMATPLYQALLETLDRQRERRGWPMWRLEERAGLSEAHLSKLLRGERLGTWATIQFIADALFPGGVKIKLVAARPEREPFAPASMSPQQLKILRAYNRHLLAEIAPMGGRARAKKLTPERRREIGRIAAAARWKAKRRLRP